MTTADAREQQSSPSNPAPTAEAREQQSSPSNPAPAAETREQQSSPSNPAPAAEAREQRTSSNPGPTADERCAGSETRLRRSTIVRAAPATVGADWAKELCATLAREGRAVEGGWPGTIIEARALVVRHLRMQLESRDMRPLSKEEVVAAAAATYECARATWLAIERRARRASRLPSFEPRGL